MLDRAENGRPLPLFTAIAQPYVDSALEGRLLMQRCPRDGFFFYPRAHCPGCLRTNWEWREASRNGVLHSFTIDRTGQDPGQRSRVPLVIALVDMADGPRLIGNIVDFDGPLAIGMPVRLEFERLAGAPLIQFRPMSAVD